MVNFRDKLNAVISLLMLLAEFEPYRHCIKLDLFSISMKLGCGHVVMDQQLSCIIVY